MIKGLEVIFEMRSVLEIDKGIGGRIKGYRFIDRVKILKRSDFRV